MNALDIPNSSDFRGMKVLVAGGAGFLGSWLSDALVARGSDVVCVDNLATGRESNVSHLMNRKNFAFKRFDIAEDLVNEELRHNLPICKSSVT